MTAFVKVRLKGLMKGLMYAALCFSLLYFFRFSLAIPGVLSNIFGKNLAGIVDFVVSTILATATFGWLYSGTKVFVTAKELDSNSVGSVKMRSNQDDK